MGVLDAESHLPCIQPLFLPVDLIVRSVGEKYLFWIVQHARDLEKLQQKRYLSSVLAYSLPILGALPGVVAACTQHVHIHRLCRIEGILGATVPAR